MTKMIALASALLMATSAGASATQRILVKKHPRALSKGTVAANGRCNSISYGTGARRCGTLSGGPVGGISGRN